MTLRVLVVGAYGNFGRIISDHLNRIPGLQLVVTGRDARKLDARLRELELASGVQHQGWCGDVLLPDFAQALPGLKLDWVIHTGGPFQGQVYRVAEACLCAGVNYCDLADCRAFVNGIGRLDTQARDAGVAILSGCSSVPSLSCAILDHVKACFWQIDSIEHGISSSAKMPGLSTVQGVLAYAGRPVTQLRGGSVYPVTGWLGLTFKRLPELGWRLVSNVDVPDMDILASRYGARRLAFKAGTGLVLGGVANALLATAIKAGLLRDPLPWARRLHRLGRHFERLSDGKSAMYLDVRGVDTDGQPVLLQAQVTAYNDKGPEIPSCAAVALMKKVAAGYRPQAGARPCVGEITLSEYLDAIAAPEHVRFDLRYTRQRP